jgi:toxin ParE1/3/4
MREIIWTEAALDDVERIAEYIAVDSQHYAAAFVRGIQKAGASLNVFPERGRTVPEFAHADIRELLVGNYRLIYILDNQTINIVTVLHSSRDLDGLLGTILD